MIQLKNYMEEIVERYVERWLPSSGACTCETCKMDIMAIMLNRLPPHYIVTTAGVLYAQLMEFDLQNQADVISAMTSAMEIVKKSPRH